MNVKERFLFSNTQRAISREHSESIQIYIRQSEPISTSSYHRFIKTIEEDNHSGPFQEEMLLDPWEKETLQQVLLADVQDSASPALRP